MFSVLLRDALMVSEDSNMIGTLGEIFVPWFLPLQFVRSFEIFLCASDECLPSVSSRLLSLTFPKKIMIAVTHRPSLCCCAMIQ